MNLPIRPRLKLRPETMRKKGSTAVDAPPPPTRSDPDNSIDSIIHRTRPVKDRFLEKERREIEQQIVQIELREENLDRRFREMRELEMKLREQERNLREESMLLAARVSFLERQAAAYQTNGKTPKDPMDASQLHEEEMRLKAREDALRTREKRLEEKEEDHAARADKLREREEAEQVQSRLRERRPVRAASPEQEELLSERERFIEESENTLFVKAQELQERETYLEQVIDELRNRGVEIDLPGDIHSSPPDDLLE